MLSLPFFSFLPFPFLFRWSLFSMLTICAVVSSTRQLCSRPSFSPKVVACGPSNWHLIPLLLGSNKFPQNWAPSLNFSFSSFWPSSLISLLEKRFLPNFGIQDPSVLFCLCHNLSNGHWPVLLASLMSNERDVCRPSQEFCTCLDVGLASFTGNGLWADEDNLVGSSSNHRKSVWAYRDWPTNVFSESRTVTKIFGGTCTRDRPISAIKSWASKKCSIFEIMLSLPTNSSSAT